MHELDGHVRGVGRIGAPSECIDAAARAQAFGNRARRARDIFGVRIEEVLCDRRAAANRRRNSNRQFGRRCTRRSTYARERIADQHVDHSGAPVTVNSDDALFRLGPHLADQDRLLTARNAAHGGECCVGVLRSDHR